MSELDETTPRAAIIVIGGVPPDVNLAAALESEGALVIAADSGAVHAKAAGLTIDIAVGDFDSIPPPLLQELQSAGVKIERHPAAKDATDLELAIDVAMREGADVITIVGGHGGRVDQSFANAFVIASPTYAHVSLHAILDSALVSVVHGGGGVTFVGEPGDVVTILPLHGDAVGVRTEGLEYPLRGEGLPAGTTRGVSNVLVDREATVSLEKGTVLVVRPSPEPLLTDDGEMQ
jgi:thiamine pyrophosphokinase